MIRVLQCIVGMNRGGLETLTMELMRHMDRQQVQFDFLVSLDGAYDDEIRELGGKIYQIPFITKCGPFVYASNLRRFFSEHPEYQVLHIQMDKFGGMTAREAARCGVPVRIVHSHNTKNEGGIAYQLVKNHYGKLVDKYATHLLACGTDAANWMFGKDASKAIIINNGIDLERFFPREQRTPGQFVVGHVGRFSKMKNHTFLLDIFKEVVTLAPESRLLLVGDGDLMPEMKEKVNRLKLNSSVEFLGTRTDVENILSQCDVLCMPSLFEGLPVTLIEAQGCGLPCLVSDRVSHESDLTGDVHFMPLESPAIDWAKKLLEYKGASRHNNTKTLESAGYSIRQTASFMQAYYLECSQNIRR